MKKLLFFGSILFIAVVLVRFIAQMPESRYRGAQAQATTNNTEYPTATQTAQPTETAIPSATIDHAATLAIAQATADEARRVNAEVTHAYLQLVQQQSAMTQQHELMVFEIYSWTVTAAPSSQAATQTQQAAINTQIPMQQAFVIAQMSATANAPTQIVAMENAKNYVKFAKGNERADIAGKYFLIAVMFSLIVLSFRLPNYISHKINHESVSTEKELQLETVVWIKNTKDNGTKSLRYTIPCSPEQLTELAENITQGKKTLGINQWEGADTLFTRDVILHVRSWLRDNQFVTPTDDGQLAPTGELFDFLCGWLETKKLPTEYEFLETQPEKALQPI
jgi:hypothetical protein